MEPKTTGQVFNNTDLSMKDIAKLPVVGFSKSLWRGRNVTLYELNGTEVVSVGVTFDGKMTVVAREDKKFWRDALNVYPGTYIYR
jgi:hypothetical protein